MVWRKCIFKVWEDSPVIRVFARLWDRASVWQRGMRRGKGRLLWYPLATVVCNKALNCFFHVFLLLWGACCSFLCARSPPPAFFPSWSCAGSGSPGGSLSQEVNRMEEGKAAYAQALCRMYVQFEGGQDASAPHPPPLPFGSKHSTPFRARSRCRREGSELVESLSESGGLKSAWGLLIGLCPFR